MGLAVPDKSWWKLRHAEHRLEHMQQDKLDGAERLLYNYAFSNLSSVNLPRYFSTSVDGPILDSGSARHEAGMGRRSRDHSHYIYNLHRSTPLYQPYTTTLTSIRYSTNNDLHNNPASTTFRLPTT